MNVVASYNEIPERIQGKLKHSNIYYADRYYDSMIKKGEKVYYVFDEDQILTAVIKNRMIFKFAVFPSEPFVFGKDSERFVDTAVRELNRKLHLDWIGPTETTAMFKSCPENAISIPFGSYMIDLGQTEEELYSKIHKSFKRDIKTALRDGIYIRAGGKELLETYLELDRETWSRSDKKALTKRVYEELLDDFPENSVIYMSYDRDNEPQSGAVFLYNSVMSYYLYGASCNRAVPGANKLLHWEAIKQFKNKNISYYNFVGCRINEDKDSKYHGIQRFKAGFGGTLEVGRMFKVIYKPLKYRLFKLALGIKNKGVIPKDIIEQEIHKWSEDWAEVKK